mmetsp:Transcript_10680/g.20475  ORF Transcript_10680/g.20475 Transcript_10680/m.20475 type:complete len:169 (+) Transcript_10680:315-821(+)
MAMRTERAAQSTGKESIDSGKDASSSESTLDGNAWVYKPLIRKDDLQPVRRKRPAQHKWRPRPIYERRRKHSNEITQILHEAEARWAIDEREDSLLDNASSASACCCDDIAETTWSADELAAGGGLLGDDYWSKMQARYRTATSASDAPTRQPRSLGDVLAQVRSSHL